VWDATCQNNLASYLHGVKGKVGIIAKGCDARAIVGEIAERQIARDRVVIIGVPCDGMIDRWKIEERLGGRELLEGRIEDDQIILRGQDFEEKLGLQEALCEGCAACAHRIPPLYDVLIGELGEAAAPAEGAAAPDLGKMTPDERWAYFSKEFERCIRCYACREACPCCYCPECFVDQTQPAWFPKSDDIADIMAFHIGRAYHMAGRCLDCGACTRACPMGINLRALVSGLVKDVQTMYGYEAGMDPEAAPALGSFCMDDPQAFIK
jgi:formate dehydrogenase (coenzyme F420) beta subunit